MTKHKNQSNQSKSIVLFVLVLVGLGLLITMLLQNSDVALFNPKGLIAEEQHKLIMFIGAALLTAGVSTLSLLYFFAWKYRESNQKAGYNPQTRYSKFFVFSLWVLPTTFIAVLAATMWSATHRLEPNKSIASNAKPLTIQVIALRWKWLFIYPEQNIAAVNFVQVPTGTPVQFELTADEAPMNSFWVPHLGGQLYAMTGHVNRLNLIADTAGDYTGRAAEINGVGFADMKFTSRAASMENFDLWVHDVKLSSDVLDSARYKALLSPSTNNSPAFYSKVDPDLYDKVLMKYMGSHGHDTEHE